MTDAEIRALAYEATNQHTLPMAGRDGTAVGAPPDAVQAVIVTILRAARDQFAAEIDRAADVARAAMVRYLGEQVTGFVTDVIADLADGLVPPPPGDPGPAALDGEVA